MVKRVFTRIAGFIAGWFLLIMAVDAAAQWSPTNIIAYGGYCGRERVATCLLDLRTGHTAYWSKYLETYGDWLPDMSEVLFSVGYPAQIKRQGAATPPTDFIETDDSITLPSWSPDGERIAYFSAIESDVFGLHITTKAGAHTAPITLTDGVVQRAAIWSPDGTRLLFFVHPVGGAGFRRDIWLHDTQTNETVAIDWLTNGGVSWNADGTQILYAVSRRSGSLLRVADLSGNMVEQIHVTDPPEYAILPSWSPGGTQIAYLAQHQIMTGISKEYLELYNFETNGKQRLIEPSFDPISAPLWLNDHILLQPLASDAVFPHATGVLWVNTQSGAIRRFSVPKMRQFYGIVTF